MSDSENVQHFSNTEKCKIKWIHAYRHICLFFIERMSIRAVASWENVCTACTLWCLIMPKAISLVLADLLLFFSTFSGGGGLKKPGHYNRKHDALKRAGLLCCVHFWFAASSVHVFSQLLSYKPSQIKPAVICCLKPKAQQLLMSVQVCF